MPSATAREVQRAEVALGFLKRRQTGSHERWIHVDGRSVTSTAWRPRNRSSVVLQDPSTTWRVFGRVRATALRPATSTENPITRNSLERAPFRSGVRIVTEESDIDWK